MTMSISTRPKPLIGVSACLLGQPVRYDATDKRQPLILEELSPWLTLSGVCPEMTAGLGAPRPPVQLVVESSRDPLKIRALGVKERGLDVTHELKKASSQLCQQLTNLAGENSSQLCGFILKSRSPSCGLGSTPVHNSSRKAIDLGNGLFAQQLQQSFPYLPCVEESWLDSPLRCRQFILACYLVETVLSQATNHPLVTALNIRLKARPEFDELQAQVKTILDISDVNEGAVMALLSLIPEPAV